MDDATRRAAQCLARLLAARLRHENPEKIAEGLRDNTLQALMAREVMMAWKEYKEAVPQPVLEDTDYFREALNEVLAGGTKVFT
jgi:hypothetical protein